MALVAFVWLFSTVSFKMSPQIALLRRCIVTQAALIQLFSVVYFSDWNLVIGVAFT